MSLDLNKPSIVIPQRKSSSRGFWLAATTVAGLALGGGLWAWGTGVQPSRLWARPVAPIETLQVDQGEIALVVTENGSLESANNTTVRCQVEALIGLVGGTQGATGTNGRNGSQGSRSGTQGGMNGQSGQTGQYGQQGQQGQQTNQTQTQSKSKTSAKAKSGASKAKTAAGASKTGAGATKQADGPQAADTTASGGAGGKGGSGSGSSQNADGSTTQGVLKPTIRSFTYQISPHQPLNPKTKSQTGTQQTKTQQDPSMAGGRGGGGGGGNRGGGPGGQSTEKAGSTRITWILPEGQWVKTGDVVCTLDSAAFEDELQAQRIRYIQAKAWVEQARALEEVSKITLQEYRDGIYPQDGQLIRQYLQTCRTEAGRAERNYQWSKETVAKGYRSAAQLKADELALQQAQLALHEAEGMDIRLEKYTAPRLKKNLEAKIAAIHADKLSLEQSFEVESDRLRKLETMVANCTMRAPGDGIVVYANQANRYGQVENGIQEGVTVRQGQPIFYLPDPNKMQVKAKVNESKISLIQSGQPAMVTIDAFPERPLHGTVTEITAIPAPANGPGSDVRVYYAVVKLDSTGFTELRPGLSAEVSFLIENHPRVTRVPGQAVRWVNYKPFVAVVLEPDPNAKAGKPSASKDQEAPRWRWQSVELGLSDPAYFEVLSGLEPGQKIVAHPETLPAPRAVTAQPAVAAGNTQPRG